MNFDPVTLAIPFYFLLIGLELLFDKIQHQKSYRLHDALTNISCGASQQIIGVFLKVLSVGIFELIRFNFAIFDIPVNWLSFVVVFILADFSYYWAHRMSHEINLFWQAGHVVHHQSEDYNYSVALRQSWFQTFFTSPFYWYLALLGFDTTQFLLAYSLNTVYQFWIHTEKVGKLGFLEWFMNTPSHHRVHHGRNPKYIDKNHAGVFIVWDRMFGTFQQEEERPTYGITTPIQTWNPIWSQFFGMHQIYKTTQKMTKFSDKIKVLFKKPGWQPDYLGGSVAAPEIDKKTYQKYDFHAPTRINSYIFFQYILTFLGIAYFLFNQQHWHLEYRILYSFLAAWAVLSAGKLFENNKTWYYIEFFRLIINAILIGIGLVFLFGYVIEISILFSLITFISVFWLLKIK
ncbi:MAG: sterol desaturase family protein [Bacteroidetes bacterium]|nr:MAG: sterol desaturase family protein [Bacteroidota bacterium]TAG92994.1 MAG: sterol desaturase family protein [Bacteroidota bacterium]